jgi:hypothetical protein
VDEKNTADAFNPVFPAFIDNPEPDGVTVKLSMPCVVVEFRTHSHNVSCPETFSARAETFCHKL